MGGEGKKKNIAGDEKGERETVGEQDSGTPAKS